MGQAAVGRPIRWGLWPWNRAPSAPFWASLAISGVRCGSWNCPFGSWAPAAQELSAPAARQAACRPGVMASTAMAAACTWWSCRSSRQHLQAAQIALLDSALIRQQAKGHTGQKVRKGGELASRRLHQQVGRQVRPRLHA